jgi:hypothetical protein
MACKMPILQYVDNVQVLGALRRRGSFVHSQSHSSIHGTGNLPQLLVGYTLST